MLSKWTPLRLRLSGGPCPINRQPRASTRPSADHPTHIGLSMHYHLYTLLLTILPRPSKMLTGRRILPALRLRITAKAARLYHDDAAFGHRVPAKYELPDCKQQNNLADSDFSSPQIPKKSLITGTRMPLCSDTSRVSADTVIEPLRLILLT